MGVLKYLDHLYGSDTEGYIQVLQLKDGQAIRVSNTNINGIVEVVQEQQGLQDTYITPNTFYIPRRANENIRHFRALYVDLDLVDHSKSEAIYEVYFKVEQGIIPKPSMIVDSGRGIHLYWRIEHAPKGASYTWQELEDYLYRSLKDLGADLRATDSARLLRLPDTINSRNGATCEVLEDNPITYNMVELREKYLHYVKKDKVKTRVVKFKGKENEAKIFEIRSPYTLHASRAIDIQTIAKLRGYDVEGYRNALIHLYSYWQGVCNRDPEYLLDIVKKFNDSFKAPLKTTEVKAVVKSTYKAVEKFIEYEHGVIAGEDKRLSKGMKQHGGYWYTNNTLIDMLNITEQEQQHLKTIISVKETRRRNNIKKYKARRNDNGLTSREQHKKDTTEAILKLRGQGLTIKEVAEELGFSVRGIKYHLYNY